MKKRQKTIKMAVLGSGGVGKCLFLFLLIFFWKFVNFKAKTLKNNKQQTNGMNQNNQRLFIINCQCYMKMQFIHLKF